MENDSFAPRVRNFSESVGLVEAIGLGRCIGDGDDNLHGLGSLFRGFAELVILGDG